MKLPCKICGGEVEWVGTIRFSQTVQPPDVTPPRLWYESDWLVSYVRCRDCGFLFTRDFDAWTDEDFRTGIYNDDYAFVDPDCEDARPAANARLVAGLAGVPPNGSLKNVRILDYGSWDGALARHLREGYGAVDVDSHDGLMAPTLKDRLYDVVTCFEVLEHFVRPEVAVKEIRDHLQLAGQAYVSTLLQPEPYPDLDWWYVGPRNGHVSMFSRKSIKILFDRFDMNVRSMGAGLHIATRRS